ncbi:FAD-dependent oxidoreductase [Sphingomonas sp. NSE70-1]|uniref:FAD-dependent oxidoreductase n=1 Tax=Sphingomonas caseinilyticus TaxID=2908205 RepID=A0ABT0RVM3_9SPHN|nr:FAD-dependent oxidoreductase [Sphingomonas caseinilyticus]MCL6699062.1 FAD-dependent oxidoreductase [Sphingomonas caseinilyticus]
MRHFAIVGSGPAGFYTAEALVKAYGDQARIDIIDRYPVPYGLIRFGVAPDHQSLKAVSKRYDQVAESEQVQFVGNVSVGSDVSADDLRALYDAVILAIGAPHDRKLGIPGEELEGVVGSAEFVGWYNGHPDFADLAPPLDGSHVAVIGNGNVALDCARVLSKNHHEFEGSDIVGHALEALDRSAVETVTILGRRGPHQISMTPKELGELGHLEAATPVVDPADFPPQEADEALEPGHRKSITILREFGASGPDASKSKRIVFDFFAKPVRIEGDGKAERLIVERTVLDETGAAKGTGELYEVPASLIVTSIGYQTPRIDGVPYDERGGKFANDHGKIDDGLYAVGWARRGPTGTIGTNRPDGYEVAEQVAAVMAPGSDGGKSGGAGLKSLLAERGVEPTSFDDWRKIEAAEVAAARPGSPREKFVRHTDWLKILGR